MIEYIEKNDDGSYSFYCPGCKCCHGVNDGWQIDIKNNTISPSVLVKSTYVPPEPWEFDENRKIIGSKPSRCHSFVRSGKIQFLNDCTHELAGKTVDMESI